MAALLPEPACGLHADGGPVPLEGVRIEARLSGPCVEVTVTQRYRNREAVPVEAVYVFPLDEGAAVCGFDARIGDRLVQGRVEERDRAFEAYDDALADGHGAFLLDQERPDVFTASVGNLRPGEVAELRLRYAALAVQEGPAVRLTLPTTVSPRYVPDRPPEVGESDGERVNPERWREVPYGLTLRVEVAPGGGLLRVESPSHPVRTELDGAGGAVVTLSAEEAALDRDFVLLVEHADARAPRAWVAREEDGTRVALVGFVPEIGAEGAEPREVLLLLDCSGSMAGDSLAQATRALQLCMRALEPEDTFDVVRFGSTWEALWGSARAFDARALAEASRWVAGDANLGGTELLAPLTHLLERPADPARRRVVLLLTDGEVANEDEVIALAGRHRASARIFTFAIGAGASHHLTRGVARASGGAFEAISPGERIEPKVLRTFGRLRTPAWEDVRVDWGGLEARQAPARVPPVFDGEALTVFARLEGGTADGVTLHAGGRAWTVPLDLEHAEAGGPVPTLWAREAIRDLEARLGSHGSSQARPGRGGATRRELVEIGVRYGVVSSATSYVAVEERPAAERTAERAALRRIPVAFTHGWGAAGRALGPGRVQAMSSGPVFSAPPMAAAALPPGAAPRAAAPVRRALGAAAEAAGALFGRRRAAGPDVRLAEPVALYGAAAPGAGDEDRLFALLMTQAAEGSFGMSHALEAWLDGAAVTRLRAAAGHGDEAVVCTAVVLALLRREAADQEDLWRAAARKATRWLGDRGDAVDVGAILGA